MGSSSAIKDSNKLILKEFRLPWVLRIAFAAGIVIPVCMIIHSSDQQLRAMEEFLQQKEEVRGELKHGRHLAQRRHQAQLRGSVLAFSARKQRVLADLDSGQLERRFNAATVAFGHGRLRRDDDDFLDIGGSTGGVSRKIVDG